MFAVFKVFLFIKINIIKQGMNSDLINNKVDEMIADLDLMDKRDDIAKNLSGG